MNNSEPINHSQEKPISKRYQTKETVYAEIYGRHDKIYCRLENLSESGAKLKILSAKFLPKNGDILKITIELKLVNKIHTIYSQVIWNEVLDLGVAFLKNDQIRTKLVEKNK